ncbi:MAG: hypothetical protein ACHP9S_01235 [Terriglobales bacterium]
MKRRLIWVAVETALAALLLWADTRLFWLYLFAVLLWNVMRLEAKIAAYYLELRLHVETIQNKLAIEIPAATSKILEQMKENSTAEEWKRLEEMYDFARRS